MKSRRTLVLSREVLSELSSDDLQAVQGGTTTLNSCIITVGFSCVIEPCLSHPCTITAACG
jgi:hypothetical protein